VTMMLYYADICDMLVWGDSLARVIAATA
jgi:hypothetical protein